MATVLLTDEKPHRAMVLCDLCAGIGGDLTTGRLCDHCAGSGLVPLDRWVGEHRESSAA